MKPKLESDTEFTDFNKDETNGKHETKKPEAPVSCSGRIRSILNYFTVEPFLLCYILPIAISNLAVQQLNLEKACRVDLNYTEEICAKVIDGDTSDNITETAQLEAIKLVADILVWQYPLQSSVPAIVILFVGAWSDRTGNRKVLMLIPTIGGLVSTFGLIWSTYFFLEWPLWVTALIEALPTSVSGGVSIALMGAYSYIADVTTIESRTFRIGVVAVIVTLGVPFGTSISGVLTQKLGYYGIFGIDMALYAIGFIHTLLRVHDVRSTKTEGTLVQKITQFFHPKNVWETISVIFMSRGRKRIQIILVICAYVVIMGPAIGEGTMLYLYMIKRYSMTVVDASLFITYMTLMGVAGTAVAVTVFSKYFNMHDTFLGIIATACKTLSSFVYGLAPTRNWFYSGPAFDFFGNSGATAIRSLGTKVVDPDNVGKMCSLIGFLDAVIPLVYPPLYSKLFSNTVETFPGAVYMLGGFMTIPAFVVFIIMFILHKRDLRDVVKNPTAKEMHAHDNDVTSF